MNLRDLEYFSYLCKLKSFTETARALYVSQPSVTMAINRLEKELNIKLIIREHSKNYFSLTEGGKILEKRALNIFNELKEAKLELSKLSGSKIKLGVPPIIGAYFFPALMEKLVLNKLAENIELVETGSIDMRKLILRGEVDMALLGSLEPIEDNNLNSSILKTDKFMVCMSKSHIISTKASLSFKDISKEKFVVLGSSYIHNKLIKSLCTDNDVSMEDFYYTDEIQTAKSLIGSGLGIGIMINMAVNTSSLIKAIPLSEPVAFYISLVTKKDHYITFEGEKIIDIITSKM